MENQDVRELSGPQRQRPGLVSSLANEVTNHNCPGPWFARVSIRRWGKNSAATLGSKGL